MNRNTLSDIIKYLTKKHKKIASHRFLGVNGMKMLKYPDGSRRVIEHFKGFRILDCEVARNSLRISQASSDIKSKRNFYSTLYLNDLAFINIYDNSAEFVTENSIDLAYILNTDDAKIETIQQYIHHDSGILRACWTNAGLDADTISRLGIHNKIRRKVDAHSRSLDLRNLDF